MAVETRDEPRAERNPNPNPDPDPNPITLSLTFTLTLTLTRQLAHGYRLLCQFKCQEAVTTFQALPQCQYNTGWVLNQVGRAHFEMVQYSEALRAFEQAHLYLPISPHISLYLRAFEQAHLIEPHP